MPRGRSSISPPPNASAPAAEAAASAIGEAELAALFALFAPYRSIALAVSGGPDSTALMLLARRWQATRPDLALTVLTVDHGLRAEAAGEAATVAALARSLGLSVRVLTRSPEPGTTAVQERARDDRYRLLQDAGRAAGVDAIATGHTRDDQAETLLMRLARGSGVDGLAAMAPVTTVHGLPVLRPLLSVPKARLIATLKAAGVAWIEDPSNHNPSSERGRLRTAAPALAAAGLAPEALSLSARRLGRARAALEAACDAQIETQVSAHSTGYASMPRSVFAGLSDEIALRVLARLVAALGAPEQQPKLTKLEALLMRAREQMNFAATLSGALIRADTRELCAFREVGRKGLPDITLWPGESCRWDRRFAIRLDRAAPGHISVRAPSRRALDNLLSRREAPRRAPMAALLASPGLWDGCELTAMPALGDASPYISVTSCLSLTRSRDLEPD
jgi:tRNA(Ile)-lysidine synthase